MIQIDGEQREVSPRVADTIREVLALADVLDGREVLDITLHVTTRKVWSTVSFTTEPRKTA